jgi:hypothetical protein
MAAIEEADMKHVVFLLSLALALAAATVTIADAKVRHKSASTSLSPGYYQPQTQAVFTSGTYAGADPDPNIRAALIREFGRRR